MVLAKAAAVGGLEAASLAVATEFWVRRLLPLRSTRPEARGVRPLRVVAFGRKPPAWVSALQPEKVYRPRVA
ncbi:hypothetical protein NL676_015787 [Syzygium grande]|nr:hypothetical protein NL676_015787 [Syzygium grande]